MPNGVSGTGGTTGKVETSTVKPKDPEVQTTEQEIIVWASQDENKSQTVNSTEANYAAGVKKFTSEQYQQAVSGGVANQLNDLYRNALNSYNDISANSQSATTTNQEAVQAQMDADVQKQIDSQLESVNSNLAAMYEATINKASDGGDNDTETTTTLVDDATTQASGNDNTPQEITGRQGNPTLPDPNSTTKASDNDNTPQDATAKQGNPPPPDPDSTAKANDDDAKQERTEKQGNPTPPDPDSTAKSNDNDVETSAMDTNNNSMIDSSDEEISETLRQTKEEVKEQIESNSEISEIIDSKNLNTDKLVEAVTEFKDIAYGEGTDKTKKEAETESRKQLEDIKTNALNNAKALAKKAKPVGKQVVGADGKPEIVTPDGKRYDLSGREKS